MVSILSVARVPSYCPYCKHLCGSSSFSSVWIPFTFQSLIPLPSDPLSSSVLLMPSACQSLSKHPPCRVLPEALRAWDCFLYTQTVSLVDKSLCLQSLQRETHLKPNTSLFTFLNLYRYVCLSQMTAVPKAAFMPLCPHNLICHI